METDNNTTDIFVKQAVKLASLEKPGNDFVPSLMDKIDKLNTQKSTVIEASPIISKMGWFVVGIIILSIFGLLFSTSSNMLTFQTFSIPYTNISFDNIISLFYSISIPRIFLVGLSIFMFYFVLQIYFLVGKGDKLLRTNFLMSF